MTESETPVGEPQTPEPALPVPANHKALTIPARRLAGSPACLNCGTGLNGPFCYYCGQPDKNLMRFFPALIRDLLEDVIDYDSRVTRTLKPLLFHPGRLTRDYLNGRRFRYVPPMRLYIFSSMLFFIIAALLASQAIEISTDNPGGGIHIKLDSDEKAVAEKLQEKVSEGKISQEEADRISSTLKTALGSDPEDESDAADDDVIQFGDEPWDRETNPFIIPGMPDFINDWINDEIEESPQKGREIEANPNLIVEKIFDVLPITVFVMLPLVALLFKFWYLFAGKYYVEHLIHALHNHSFLFLIFLLVWLAEFVAVRLDPTETGLPSKIALWWTILLLSWIPVYLLISLKTVYRQSWPMTLAKFSLIGISYLILLATVTVFATVLGFVLL